MSPCRGLGERGGLIWRILGILWRMRAGQGDPPSERGTKRRPPRPTRPSRLLPFPVTAASSERLRWRTLLGNHPIPSSRGRWGARLPDVPSPLTFFSLPFSLSLMSMMSYTEPARAGCSTGRGEDPSWTPTGLCVVRHQVDAVGSHVATSFRDPRRCKDALRLKD